MDIGLLNPPNVALLEQVVAFAQRRHTVLAGNIANLDTPGYQVRDLSVEDFQARLREALAQAKQAPAGGSRQADALLRELVGHSPGWAAAAGPAAGAAKSDPAKVGAGRSEPQLEDHPAPRPGQRGPGIPGDRNGQEPDATQPGAVASGQTVSPAGNGHQRACVKGVPTENHLATARPKERGKAIKKGVKRHFDRMHCSQSRNSC